MPFDHIHFKPTPLISLVGKILDIVLVLITNFKQIIHFTRKQLVEWQYSTTFDIAESNMLCLI